MCVYCRFKSGCGQVWTCVERSPCLQGETQIRFGVDERTVGLPQLLLRQVSYLRLGSPRKRVREQAHEVVEIIFSTWKTR